MSARLSPRAVLWGGVLLVAVAFVAGSARGAYAISPQQLWQVLAEALRGALGGSASPSPEHLVFMNIRLPRLLLGAAAGAGLGLSGALMQGLFRNPLADPGLVGISSGAALAAGVTIVLGGWWFPELPRTLGSWTLVLMAFAGGLTVTLLIYALAQTQGGTHIGLMLLAGVAVNALAGAGLGFLSFMASDEQLRNIQFWLLGSLGGARWSAVGLVGALVFMAGCAALGWARPLNAMALGEAQAALLGVNVERAKRALILVTAVIVGAVTATTGIIGFVGLIAPHWVRLVAGPDHRVVLPASALLGAALVLAADALARTVAKPAELPLGVLTAVIGVPMFLLMLRHFRGRL
ncbi:MAG: iron ABC transporter permease [Ramlibacter sp.]|nr:iron ABC transporter permease [Ramlibacter sp.]